MIVSDFAFMIFIFKSDWIDTDQTAVFVCQFFPINGKDSRQKDLGICLFFLGWTEIF